ncbi:hypothetical protein IU11_07390 [Cellulosimicrobium sp. MM]|nr:hypothetical protein IU11_07390 [Cellulosimicrobium sp. MM]
MPRASFSTAVRTLSARRFICDSVSVIVTCWPGDTSADGEKPEKSRVLKYCDDMSSAVTSNEYVRAERSSVPEASNDCDRRKSPRSPYVAVMSCSVLPSG